ncbi:Protein NEOXANTHIN-DEFICIENT 1 [Linum perenne]
MEEEAKSSGYGKPPWIFKGSALYQLHLVKADTARAFVPKDSRLVEAFGYTLGGFFLANYEDSPAGSFDELVVIAGIVWNPPTSCAWAARVLVSSEDACHHGRKEVGLPSHVAKFSKRTMAVPVNQKSRDRSFLSLIGFGASVSPLADCLDVQVTEVAGQSRTNICNISLTSLVPGIKVDQSIWPMMTLSLPSFSGRTEYNPNLLKYSCNLKCRIRPVKPATASSIRMQDWEEAEAEAADKNPNLTQSILLSTPILALEFSSLEMKVGAPIVVSDFSKKSNSCGSSLDVA